MRKKIRSLAIVLTIVMLGAMLAACSGKPTATSGNNTSKNGSSTESSSGSGAGQSASGTKTKSKSGQKLKPVTLKFILGGDTPSDKKNVLNALYKLTKDRLNAKFEFDFVPGSDYQNKLTLLAASGDNYDAAFTADWFGYANMLNKGAFLDISKLLPKYAPDLYKMYKSKHMLKDASVGNKVYALPWTVIKTSKPVFRYRKDIADKLNIQPGDLTTIEGIDKFLGKVAKAKPDVQTIFDMNISNSTRVGDIVALLTPKYQYLDMGFHDYYMDLNDPKHKVMPLEETPLFKEAVKLAVKWRKEGIISKDATANKNDSPYLNGQTFSGKNIDEALYQKTNFSNPNYKNAAVEVYPNNKFARDSQMNNAIAINKNAAHPKRTLMFLNLLSTDKQVYDTLMYGIKGETYTLKNGVVGLTPGENPAHPKWQNWGSKWGFVRQKFRLPTTSISAKAMQEEYKYATRPNIVISPIAGFVPDSSQLKTLYAKRDQLYATQGRMLLAGIIQDGNTNQAINDFIAKQKAAGLDKITANLQKQVDDFLNSK